MPGCHEEVKSPGNCQCLLPFLISNWFCFARVLFIFVRSIQCPFIFVRPVQSPFRLIVEPLPPFSVFQISCPAAPDEQPQTESQSAVRHWLRLGRAADIKTNLDIDIKYRCLQPLPGPVVRTLFPACLSHYTFSLSFSR